MKEYTICPRLGEHVICDINCVFCNEYKRNAGKELFRRKYQYVKGQILPINQDRRKKRTI